MSTILSPNKYDGRVKPIRVIVLHTMESPEGEDTAEAVGNFFSKTATKASAHVGVDPNSECRYVADTDTAWATPNVNSDGLQLEMAGRAGQNKGQWEDAASKAILERAAKRVAEWCKKWKIPPIRISNAQLKAGAKGIIDHNQASDTYGGSHWDVGPSFPWFAFLDRVRDLMGSIVIKPPTVITKRFSLQDCKNMQAALGTTADGKWGAGTDARALTLHLALLGRRFNVLAVQRILGVRVDGAFGPASKAALVKKIIQIQAVLSVARDGSWGPVSDKAFVTLRAQFNNKF